ncbi:glycoside hydrolase family 98 domain-containing protein [Mucilaginibacter sp. RCC_168]|uniref:glycoside hydrolase family 98 domain-containing protein n=1 Tax=unclassified Mucilaginibacter TaxID=2617802 RepID=UPI00088C5B90|nr:glycoside hydrolase family 98 domain-containing protein [Mucilaginibacter sp. OK268]SDP14713.1 Cellulose binding domain-containing protein [Mucilaginibacter sp. OK268]
MKKNLLICLIGALSLICNTYTLAQTQIVYDFDAGHGLGDISQASGSLEISTLVNANDNGVANTTQLLHPLSVGTLNQTGVSDLTSFVTSTDYAISWKEYITQGATTYKKGFLLRGSGTGGYATGIKKGYYFMVQNNGTTGSVSFRILNSSASTALAELKNVSLTIPGFAVNKACWFRASISGNVLTFAYSMDGTNFTTGAIYTDAANLYSSGATQLVYGIASPVGQYYYDDIAFKASVKASSTITVTGASNYLYNGSAQGPQTANVTGSTGTVSYSYSGTGTTSYGPSVYRPVVAGTYQVIATVNADDNYQTAVSAPFPFSISSNPSFPVAAMRRSLSPTRPMYLLHADVWAHQPQQVIDLIPADMRANVVINISLSTSILGNNGYNCAESWLNTCAQNGIWAMVQVSSGIQNAFAADTALTLYESLYKKYPNFIGYNFAEQAWGFDANTFQSRLNLFVNLLAMGQKYGGYLYINDNFSVSNASFNTVAKLKTSTEFANATKVYKDHMIYGDKFTHSYGYYDNESGALGAFLSGHAGNYAIRYDQYSWPFSGRGQVFGPEVVGGQNTDGNRGLFACPEAVMGVPIVEHLMLTGATVIDGPEVPWMTTVIGNYRLPAFNNMLADVFRKVLDGTIRIPGVDEVAGRTKIAFVNDVDYNTTDSLFAGLYAMDGALKNNRTWFKKSGRYASIPELYSSASYETSLLSGAALVKKSEYKTRWTNEVNKINEFNSLYPTESNGDMFVARMNNSLYTYNPYINTDKSAMASIPFKYNTCDSVVLSYPAHTLGVINESNNKLKIYLNNYRTDKNQLWSQYPNDFTWGVLQNTILPAFAVSPWDGTLRTSVIKIYGATLQPGFIITERGSHQSSTANAVWTNGVYTLTVTHNGPVDITVDCAGAATGRLTAPLPVTMDPLAAADPYTGDKEYEAEGGIIIAEASTAKSSKGYHGTGYVTFSSSSTAGSAVGFKVFNIPADTTYQLQTRYTAAKGNVTKLDLFVNGAKIRTPVFAATATDSTWTVFTQNVKLKAGIDTIMFKANAAGANINMDKIILTKQVLPFSFVSVNAVQKNNSQIQVDWRVAAEENLLEYELQKSTDGVNFSTIYTVNANNTEDSYYVHLDTLSANLTYYKVKATDQKGVITYSAVAKVSKKAAVVVQAESGKLGTDWSVVTSDVSYITSKTDLLNSAYPGDSSKVATYQVTFDKPGSYDLYAKIWVGTGAANDDSFYYGQSFGIKNPFADNSDWITANNLAGKGYIAQGDTVKADGTAGNSTWKWINLSGFNGGDTPVTFTVQQNALTQTFQIGSRENGLQIDKFVFGASDQRFTVLELDSLAGSNWPPIIKSGQIFTVSEGADSSLAIGKVIASDPDAGTVLGNWKITGGTGAALFGINTLGVIKVLPASQIDFEHVSSYTLKLRVNDGANWSEEQSITINLIRAKKAQTITFEPIPAKLLGDTDFTIAATSTSNLPIAVTSSNELVATVVSNQIHIVGVGQSVITASQPGDSTYLAADGIGQNLAVSPVDLAVQYVNKDNSTSDNTVRPEIQILNNGNNAINYNEITLRYWLTPENYAGINTWIDYAQIGSSNVNLLYKPLSSPKTGALGYLEYSFKPSAGLLSPKAQSGPIRSRAANIDWSNLDETDDYSYLKTSSPVTNNHITIYRNGVLIWGIEPAAATQNLQLTASILTVNTAAITNAISNYIKISNIGNIPVDYGDLSFRYWFTNDGNTSLNYWLDYAKLGNGNLSGAFSLLSPVKNMADTYLEVKFNSNAGQLYPLSSTGNIQHRISKGNWSNFVQSNDYSFSGSSAFVLSNKITIYYKGAIIFGNEPDLASYDSNLMTSHNSNSISTHRLSDKKIETNMIYPNPVAGASFNVKTTADLHDQLINVRIFDMKTGSVILNRRFQNSSDGILRVDLNSAPQKGVYSVQLNSLPMIKMIVDH